MCPVLQLCVITFPYCFPITTCLPVFPDNVESSTTQPGVPTSEHANIYQGTVDNTEPSGKTRKHGEINGYYPKLEYTINKQNGTLYMWPSRGENPVKMIF